MNNLTIKIKFLNESLIFNNTIDLKRYLIDLNDFWKGVVAGEEFSEILISSINALNDLEKSININDSYSSAANKVNSFLESDRWPTAKIIEDRILKADGKKVASYLLGVLRGDISLLRDFNGLNQSYFILGVVDRDFLTDESTVGETILKKANRKIEEAFENLSDIIEIKEKAEELKNTHEDLTQKYTSDFLHDIAEFKEYLEELKKEYSEKITLEISNAKEVASQKIKLQKSFEYWKLKYRVHASKAKNALKNFKILSLILLLLVPFLIYFTNKNLQTSNEKFFDPASICIGVIIALSFWVLRISSKLWLSHEHLKNDAHEKMVMTQTYLALSLDSMIDENQKAIFLTSIFKSVQDGIVKDEGPISPILEVIKDLRNK